MKRSEMLLFPSSRGVVAHQGNAAKQPLKRRRGGQKHFWPPRPPLFRGCLRRYFL